LDRLFCKRGGRNNSSEETNRKWRDDKDDGVKETLVLIGQFQRYTGRKGRKEG
jgi:hypothetical protein